MTGFIVRRILSSILVVVLTSMFVFVLFFKGMGDSPAVNYCDSIHKGRCSPATLASIKHQMGYDRSVAANYAIWAKGIFVGRETSTSTARSYPCPAPCLGVSEMTDNTVWHDLKQKYPATITVAVGGASIYLTFGVLMGAFAARWRGTAADRLLVGGSLIWSAIPDYVIILLAWVYFSLRWHVFPNVGYYPITENPLKTISWMMLPWLVLGFTSITDYARFTRGQMVETLGEDYIRTAQAKGVRPSPRALPACAAGRDRPGDHDLRTRLRQPALGHDLHRADLRHRRHRPLGTAGAHTPIDINVLSTAVLVGAVLVVVANLVVDIVYGFLDPRVTVT